MFPVHTGMNRYPRLLKVEQDCVPRVYGDKLSSSLLLLGIYAEMNFYIYYLNNNAIILSEYSHNVYIFVPN